MPIAAVILAAPIEAWRVVRDTLATMSIIRFLSAVSATGALLAAETG